MQNLLKRRSVNKEKEEKETKKGTNGCIVLKRTLFLSREQMYIFRRKDQNVHCLDIKTNK